MADPIETIENIFNPLPPAIKKIFPGAKVIPIEEFRAMIKQ